MNKFLFVFCSIVSSLLSFSQQSITTVEDVKGLAKEHYQRAYFDVEAQKFWMADSLLRMAIAEKENFIDAWFLLGQINMEYLKRDGEAERALEKVKALKADYVGDIDFQLGMCNLNLGDYDSARMYIKLFLQHPKIPAEQRFVADKILVDCDFAESAVKQPVDFKPINIGSGVNTIYDESMPSLTADGKYLCFTRHIGYGQFADEDIYMSLHTSVGFAQATSISDMINTERFIEGAQNFSPSGKYLFFTSADRPDRIGSGDIYISRKTGDLWERANNIGRPVNTPGYETQPCISADGRDLYFAGVRATGYGKTDIWVSHLNPDGTWGEPENLGSNINTMFNEMRPYIHPDGNTLYFASQGHPGMGNYDIYVSYRQQDGTWGKPINFGYPINTPGDELGVFVTADGSNAYFSSEQKDSKGQGDIYTFEMPLGVRPGYTSYIKGNVFDSESRESIHATVQIYDLESGKLFTTVSTDKVNGYFLCTLPSGKNYGIAVQKDGYLFYSHNIYLINVKEGMPYELDIPLHKIQVGETVVLNNIFFETEKYKLMPQSAAELEIIIKLMSNNPTLEIEIGGHTDNTGTETVNKTLSENRAKSVFDYLAAKGISTERMSYKGYASSKPVAPNATAEGRAKNRRTEFKVIAIQ